MDFRVRTKRRDGRQADARHHNNDPRHVHSIVPVNDSLDFEHVASIIRTSRLCNKLRVRVEHRPAPFRVTHARDGACCLLRHKNGKRFNATLLGLDAHAKRLGVERVEVQLKRFVIDTFREDGFGGLC